MTAQQLKNSILQMAVQGKLVPQDPNDEPASVLLERIRGEKQRLVKDGKIKKEKPLPPITEDDIPFDVPESWEWVRIGSIFNLQAGKFVQAQDIHSESENRFPCYGGNGLRGFVDSYNRDGAYQLIGRQGALCGNINYAEGQFYATEHAVVVEYFCDVDVRWIGYFLTALNLNQYSTATAQPGLAVANINNVLIPLPPLTEQHRIVERIEQLLPHIAEYDTAEQKLTALNKTFPDQLKKSILQAAVQGKLVEQDPNDEPASALLERIRAEKELLLKEGKIKKEKPLPPITDEELPFDVPENWEWVRLGALIQLISGQDMTPDKYNVNNCGTPYLTGASNIENERVLINRWTPEPKSIAIQGDLLLTCKGTVGAMAFFCCEAGHIARQIMAIRMGSLLCNKYVKIFLETYVATLKATAKSMIPGISRDDVLNALIPLPPLAEQQRIVAKCEELLAMVEQCN